MIASHTLLVVCILALNPLPVRAFLSIPAETIISSSVLPQLISLVFGLVLTVYVFVKKHKPLSYIFFAILAAGIAVFMYTNMHVEKKSLSTRIQRDEHGPVGDRDWLEFLNNYHSLYTKGDELYFVALESFVSLADYKEILSSLEATEVNFDDYDVVIGTSEHQLRVMGSIDLFVDFYDELIMNIEDPSGLETFLKGLNITKDKRMLVYCTEGHSSSFVSYVLDNFGYNVKFYRLKYLDNYDKINYRLFEDDYVIRKEANYLDTEKNYLSFILAHNNYHYWFCPEDITGNTTVLSSEKAYREGKGKSYTCTYGVNFSKKKNITFSDLAPVAEDAIYSLDLGRYHVLCLNNWHCFLTKHYLDTLGLQNTFDILYCIDCK